MLPRVSLLLCLIALCAPAAAVAQSNPFGPINPAPLPQPVPEDTGEDTDRNEGEGDLSGWQEGAIYGGGALIIALIGWVILRDARKAAPVEDRRRKPEDDRIAGALGGDKPRDPHAPRRKQQARAKAKAARKARKTTKRGR